ncbi:MAG: isochorismate synthase [Chloroflexi bacterium]|nr:isochorismate synthase [Chloroflexota bacterium]
MTASPMVALPFPQALASLLSQAGRQASVTGHPILVSTSHQMDWPLSPVDTFAACAGLSGYRAFWGCPSEGFWLVGLGCAEALSLGGPEPFLRAQEAWRSLLAGAVVEGSAHRGAGPLLLGGFRFDPLAARDPAWHGFPDAHLMLSRLLLTWTKGQVWLTINAMVSPGEDPLPEVDQIAGILGRIAASGCPFLSQPPAHVTEETTLPEWERRVHRGLKAISRGELAKVVLARKKGLAAATPFSPERAIAYLEQAYPRCAVFAFDQGEACFLGASPESLVRLDRGEVSLSCMAGTTHRGDNDKSDEAMARNLLADPKERREHDLVVSQVAQGLSPLCDELYWDAFPRVVRLKGVQHLATSFVGSALAGKDVLDIVAALHPTPAVGGVPQQVALEVICQLEGDRGWYGAPVGWVDASGQGEFWVGIRSALLRGNHATLYAGAGIVEGSDPEREFQETELKFQPLLRALGQE